jgi:glycosyltransferase involved in cell wall biosynthesis
VKIRLVGPAHPYKGGGARHTTELAHQLAAQGHEVVIESWRAQYPARLYPGQQTVDEPEGEPYPRTRRSLAWYDPASWFTAGRRLRDADLVVFALLTPIQVPAYLVMLTALGKHPSTVVLCHNVLPHERRPGDVALTRTLLRRAGAVLVHSEAQAAEAGALAPGTPVHVASLPPHWPHAQRARGASDPAAKEARGASDPVAKEARAPRAPSGGGSRAAGPLDGGGDGGGGAGPLDGGEGGDRDGGAGGGDVRLLFFGIVRPYKGLDVLLRALAGAPENLTLTVAGEFWGGTAGTEKLVAELGLNGRVTLMPGYVKASVVPGLFANADVLVLPYRAATASQNVLLAFAHGVPVIASRAGAIADQVTDGVNGITVAPGDVDDLARALRLVSERGTLERLRAGVLSAGPQPSWDDYLAALLRPADSR